jgi:hypothetical protein
LPPGVPGLSNQLSATATAVKTALHDLPGNDRPTSGASLAPPELSAPAQGPSVQLSSTVFNTVASIQDVLSKHVDPMDIAMTEDVQLPAKKMAVSNGKRCVGLCLS